MLSAEQVKPLLHDDDPFVRNLASDYFHESWSRDADVAHLILRACRQYGTEMNIRGLSGCDHYPVSEESLDDLLKMLFESQDLEIIRHLHHIIQHVAGDVLLRRESALHDDALKFSPEVLRRIERRIDMCRWTGAKLWQELESVDGRCDDPEFIENTDFSYSEDLLDALARHDEPSEASICDRLRSLADRKTWLESSLVDLAGDRRISRAVPLLLDCLLRDDEFLAEQATIALAKIGDPEAARLIRQGYSDQPWVFRNFAAGVLHSIKHPVSEQAILDLLEIESECDIRGMLCLALCDMFSEQGVAIVRSEIKNEYDRIFGDLEDRLLTVVQVLGIEIPEAKRWRANRKERIRSQAKQQAEIAVLLKKYEALKARGIDPFAPLAKSPPNLVPIGDTVALKELERPRVGRNAECPCGSGKKFKKCCGRKS